MESLSRVILFLTSYFIVLALSFSINTESEYLQIGLFLVISIIIASWLYFLHFKKKEVKALMKLFLEAINEQPPDLIKNKVKLNFIGEISRFDKVLIKQIKKSQENTSKYNSKMNLNIAISYGGRWDLEQALKKIIDDILKETIKIRNLNEDLISNYLSTSQINDPDMIIRSGGEKRISNFFLWQAAYSEIYFSDKLWPDFNEKDFKEALNEFSSRKRKFGVKTGI